MMKRLQYRKRELPPLAEMRAEIERTFRYDREQGKLYWKVSVRPQQDWLVGRLAGGADGSGYLTVRVFSHRLKVHRIIWLLERGSWPNLMLDHINGNRMDNRIENLREATEAQNIHNRVKSGRYATGVWKNGPRYIARIQAPGAKDAKIYLGTFDTEAEAAAAYVGASVMLHGEYAAAPSRNGWDADGADRPASPSLSPSVTMNDGADSTIRTCDQRFTKALHRSK